MPEPDEDVERVIFDVIGRYSGGNPKALARAILKSLWEAGYDVTLRPDMIPIRHNPGEGAVPPYTAEQERAAQGLAPADLFQRLANEPRNAAIRDKIGEIARAFRHA